MILGVACFAFVTLQSCKVPSQQLTTASNSPLTHANVQLNLEIGKTTQQHVLETFGAPNITTIVSSGQEVWAYQRAASVSRSSSNSSYATIILAGGSSKVSGLETSSKMMTLLIKFDSDKVVSDFRSRSSTF